MLNNEARKASASPITESGSHDHVVGDDALSQGMLRIFLLVSIEVF